MGIANEQGNLTTLAELESLMDWTYYEQRDGFHLKVETQSTLFLLGEAAPPQVDLRMG